MTNNAAQRIARFGTLFGISGSETGEELKPSMARAPKLKGKSKKITKRLQPNELYKGEELKYEQRGLKDVN
jgi:hypothetical protein